MQEWLWVGRAKQEEQRFSLVELMIVVAIIGTYWLRSWLSLGTSVEKSRTAEASGLS